ncbi:cell division protein FtsI (penicillin-binding protein 3) [Dysgonomonas sp. PH5-45]|uniref:penicillin-binding protein n=1 Tax=unclassified Dysgonomonas TaxID=2630389 RepID=UPI0024766E6F|nr:MULTISPECIES: penicillin-binding transpeptidase domain-containing protein [unclassified Dysgonomonas]MDH6355714.1 cell division protein FtsI (penicillin-binding protein 3) [Dysgonomonas sp. PH5-45]MDH6388611.1 cell division protein FtsI (penicillin-binding protein 3) [Dysgonomonas sp. PH5-37]
MSDKVKNSKKKNVINRYGLIVMLLSVVFVVVLVFIVRIMFVEGEVWREVGRKETVKKDRIILPNRGNIYAADGRLLAASQPLYGIYVDFMSEGIRKDSLMKHADALSKALANKFGDRSAAEYRRIFMDGWKQSRIDSARVAEAKKAKSTERVKVKSRYIRIIKRDINYLELKEIRAFPFFNQKSNRSGLIAEERTTREKPFGRLAGRTIGSIYKEIEKGGASGIELKCDTVLKGFQGVKSRQKVQGRWIDIVEVPARDGIDVHTTIDIDIQDITERALRNKLVETDAESGCAVIMEVETGEIKAIANLDRLSEGVYAEGNPNAFSYMSEPGSTFKTLSLMVALEDGIVTPQDSFYVGRGLFEYKGKVVRDHDWRHGRDRGYETVSRGMYSSLNTVISKMILKGYENNPERYVKRLYDLGVTKKIDWDVPLSGKEGTAQIRSPKDKSNPWSKTTLAWMSFGYETQVPPIYMLMFYNGIANNGKMIKPFLIKSYMKDGKVVKEFATDVINPSLCSAKTLKQVQDILVGVVNEGTARAVRSDGFQIAGKTGTAMIASGGGYSGYYVSFCGYFPAEKPKYTCFVGIRRPKGSPSGGLQPGKVFKDIAEGVFAKDIFVAPATVWNNDSITKIRLPYIKNGRYDGLKTVLAGLNINHAQPAGMPAWVKTGVDSTHIMLSGFVPKKGLVPDVGGMGARDAVYILENAGLKVKMVGAGKVFSQSIAPGTKIVKGSVMTIGLK